MACLQIIDKKLKSLCVDWSLSCGNASSLGSLVFPGFSSNVCWTKSQKSRKGNFGQLTQDRVCRLSSSPESSSVCFLARSWLSTASFRDLLSSRPKNGDWNDIFFPILISLFCKKLHIKSHSFSWGFVLSLVSNETAKATSINCSKYCCKTKFLPKNPHWRVQTSGWLIRSNNVGKLFPWIKWKKPQILRPIPVGEDKWLQLDCKWTSSIVSSIILLIWNIFSKCFDR